MLVLRVLTGPLAGKFFQLQPGANVIGRSSSAKIQIPSNDISKEHAKITVDSNKVTITDLNSTNGTFINGVRVKSQELRPSDKIMLYKILLEITEVAAPAQIHPSSNHSHMDSLSAQPNLGQNQNGSNIQNEGTPNISPGLKGFLEHAKNYIENVVLPGVYKLPEWLEFKWVLGIMMVLFIIAVTSLSAIPLVRILKDSVENESQRRALTIARALARVNKAPIMDGQDSVVSVRVAEEESGVKNAYVIKAADGSIIAPARRAGEFIEGSFIHAARKYSRETVGQIDDDTIGALAPIDFYSADTGGRRVEAFAVVIYDMGSLAVNDERTLSLFIQTFFISLIVGSLLFFFLYKMIEHPIKSLNNQLDLALKDGSDNIEVKYEFPELQGLAANISSALTRALTTGDDFGTGPTEYDRSTELSNLSELFGFGSMVINVTDNSIVTFNDIFADRTSLNIDQYRFSPISSITDQALKLSLEDLIQRACSTPEILATNELDLGGANYELAAQAIYGLNSVSYVVVVLLPSGEEAYA